MEPMTMMALMGAAGKGGGEGAGAGGAAGGAGGMMNPWMGAAGGAVLGSLMAKEKEKAWREQRDVLAEKEAYSPWTRLKLPAAAGKPSALNSVLRGVAMGMQMGGKGGGKGEENPWGGGAIAGGSGGYGMGGQHGRSGGAYDPGNAPAFY